jgi:dipeptidase D
MGFFFENNDLFTFILGLLYLLLVTIFQTNTGNKMSITSLLPNGVWANFNRLCQIPRPSKNEAKVIEFVVDFAQKHKLEYVKDEVGNVLIRKPGVAGKEHKPVIVLQAHLDMVPQKNSDTVHDFKKDPIQPVIDGEWVRAKGTTLGADNGIGVAAALALLESSDIAHGPIEVLLTIDEETGMTGAFHLQPGILQGQILLNLDSEDEGELFIGCAGGLNTTATFNYVSENVPAGMVAFRIALTGFKGGHSGVDIHLGRGNANKLMNRFLWKSSRDFGLRISAIEGGSLRNAIPRESFVVATIPIEYKEQFLDWVIEFRSILMQEFSVVESNIIFDAQPVSLPISLIDQPTQDRLLNAVYAAPNGVVRMQNDMPGVVETSTNLAIIRSTESFVEVKFLLRSSLDSAKDDLANAMTSVFELAGAVVKHDGNYPGWKPNVNSEILALMKNLYNSKYGKTPEIKVIHAGLECGIIGNTYGGMDMISFGPTIRYPHSPDEKVQIASVVKFWDFLVETLIKL